MSQKKSKKFHKILLFSAIIKRNVVSSKPVHIPMLTSLEYNLGTRVNNTGDFFKKITFWALAVSNLKDKRYRSTTLRSTLMSLWNLIGAYNIIF